MQTIVAESLQDLYRSVLITIIEEGKEVEVRGLMTKEIHPCLMHIINPKKRTLLYPKRGNNPFATLAETLWVLAGRNDMKFLTMFLPRAADFSDDGEVWRAGYGPRMRKWFYGECETTDQIKFIVKQLMKDQNSRQAVMSIWDPAEENTVEKTKDYPCFVGSTIVHSPEGNKQIKDIPIGYPVYSYDENTETIVIRKVKNSKKTGRKRIWRVYLDDGSVIETTKHHKFMTKHREKLGHENKHGTSSIYEYIETKDLVQGTRLIPIHYFYDDKGYKLIHLYPKKNWANGYRIKESRMYWEFVNGPIQDEFIIHHKDGNKCNNSIDNLSCMQKIEHDSKETALQKIGLNNPNAKTGSNYKDIHVQRFVGHNPEELINWGKEVLQKRGKLTNRICYEELKQTDYRMTELYHAFGSFGNFKSIIYNNHKVERIERTNKFEDVYDIEVEDCHNFFVGSGVLVHNCCNWIHFMVRDDALDCTVVVRSNDAIWGLSSINVYEWTVLQEILANILGVKVGQYYQMSDSLHLYQDVGKNNNWESAINMAKSYIDLPNLPTFEFAKDSFCDERKLANDSVAELKTYLNGVEILCNELLKGIKTKLEHKCHEDLNQIFDLLNWYVQRETFKDIKGSWKDVLSLIAFSDLKVACDYWVRKNVYKEKDTGRELIEKCIDECKT